MLVDKTNGHLDSVKAFAERTGQTESLENKLEYLGGYACHDTPEDTRCLLFTDFAPMSFEFLIEKRGKDGEYTRWFNGGLIFHGDHDNGGDGGAPTFSVNLNSANGWSIHT